MASFSGIVDQSDDRQCAERSDDGDHVVRANNTIVSHAQKLFGSSSLPVSFGKYDTFYSSLRDSEMERRQQRSESVQQLRGYRGDGNCAGGRDRRKGRREMRRAGSDAGSNGSGTSSEDESMPAQIIDDGEAAGSDVLCAPKAQYPPLSHTPMANAPPSESYGTKRFTDTSGETHAMSTRPAAPLTELADALRDVSLDRGTEHSMSPEQTPTSTDAINQEQSEMVVDGNQLNPPDSGTENCHSPILVPPPDTPNQNGCANDTNDEIHGSSTSHQSHDHTKVTTLLSLEETMHLEDSLSPDSSLRPESADIPNDKHSEVSMACFGQHLNPSETQSKNCLKPIPLPPPVAPTHEDSNEIFGGTTSLRQSDDHLKLTNPVSPEETIHPEERLSPGSLVQPDHKEATIDVECSDMATCDEALASNEEFGCQVSLSQGEEFNVSIVTPSPAPPKHPKESSDPADPDVAIYNAPPLENPERSTTSSDSTNSESPEESVLPEAINEPAGASAEVHYNESSGDIDTGIDAIRDKSQPSTQVRGQDSNQTTLQGEDDHMSTLEPSQNQRNEQSICTEFTPGVKCNTSPLDQKPACSGITCTSLNKPEPQRGSTRKLMKPTVLFKSPKGGAKSKPQSLKRTPQKGIRNTAPPKRPKLDEMLRTVAGSSSAKATWGTGIQLYNGRSVERLSNVKKCNDKWCQWLPQAHGSRAACERCWTLASRVEREEFIARGRHLRIALVKGGCASSCTLFSHIVAASPNKKDGIGNVGEEAVRLCLKCFNDLHHVGIRDLEK